MADTHGVGRIYVTHTQYLPPLPGTQHPLLEVGWTQESEEPYRIGKSLVVRLPFSRRAAVLGWWIGRDDQQTALFHPLTADGATISDWTGDTMTGTKWG